MYREIELSEQVELFGNIVERLSALTLKIREAFVHHQSSLFEVIEKQQLDLNEEIAFVAVMVDEQVVGKSLDEKEPAFRFENILTHLQMMGKSLKQLAAVLLSPRRGGVFLLDSEIDQVVMLLERQEDILRSIGGIARSGDNEKLKVVSEECRELAHSFLMSTSSYESRQGEVLGRSETSPALLAILGRFQAVVRHELEALILLTKWNWDRAAGNSDERMA